MKEKIQLLSRGVFEYENPIVELSDSSIELEVEYGSKYSGYFDLTSRNHIEIRAMIFSSNKRMQCLESTIIGTIGRVHYVFDAQGMAINEKCEGYFEVVSNGGEYRLPYHIHVKVADCETSIGTISDIDQFAALAKDNWSEALKIFKTPDFKRIFLHHKKNQMMYETLIKSNDLALAMEEFLCTVKRKQPVHISVSKDKMEYTALNEQVSEKLIIEKSDWGHVKINVSTEGSFLTVYKQTITDEDFLGSFYELEYEVRPNDSVNHNGKIILENFNQRIEIPIICQREKIKNQSLKERRSLQSAWTSLYRKYLDLQFERITLDEWRVQAREEIDGCTNNSRDLIYRVIEADYLLSIHHEDEALTLMESINGRELRYSSAIWYSYYLYVNARCKRDWTYTAYVKDTIEFYREGEYQDRWELLYILIQLDERRDEHVGRIFREIKQLHGWRVIGPLLYMEAVKIVNENPTFIREMGSFEISLLLWGVRNESLNREAIYRFADLVLRMKDYHAQCLHTMMDMCRIYETKTLLSAVLHLLILGERKEKEFHEWYQLGIKSAIKMPDLYEYYMATLDMAACDELPMSVLIYFQYDNKLPIKQREFIYRYVIEHRGELTRVFDIYDSIIREYIVKQLESGRINKELAVLYDYYFAEEILTLDMKKKLPNIIFKQQLHCNEPSITGVVVDYAEIEEEQYYPMSDGDAFIDLFMDDYRIILIDESGSRYTITVEYTLSPLLDTEKYIQECELECLDNEMILLNRSERALKYQTVDETSIDVYKRTLLLPNVNTSYRETILKNLIDYYVDNYEGETLEKYLLRMDVDTLGQNEKSQMIGYLIWRGLFDKAYAAIEKYGYDGIADKRIMRLSSRIIRERDFEKEDLLLELAYFAFSKGKYDETILQYLIRYYVGSTESLYAIWQASQEFEVQATELEERMICEILFAETMIDKGCEVFASYYNSGHPVMRIVKAFLGYYGYHYLAGGENVSAAVFQIMEIELDQLEQSKNVCTLALMKYYADDESIEPLFYEKLQKAVSAFMDRGILLPFFAKYAGSVNVPEELAELSYVEYHANPKHQVVIHYIVPGSEGDTFVEEPMVHMISGIFVKPFRLFEDETLVYFITENDGTTEIISERQELKPEKGISKSLKTGVDQLNVMIEQLSHKNKEALDESIKEYDKLDEITDELFELK